MNIIGFEDGERAISWGSLLGAFEAGHRLPKAEIADIFLYRDPDTLLTRSAWIDGLGLAVKSATIFPGNKATGMPAVNGAVSLFSDSDGTLEAILDFHLVTKWKTCGDSLYAARLLAPPKTDCILIVGTGTVAGGMVSAYRSLFPTAEISVWGRNRATLDTFCANHDTFPLSDLEAGVSQAQLICTATMATEPLIKGEWLQAGQHLDLIGAYRPDMREVDDLALQRSSVFVDSFETTLGHIGELKIPLASGAIKRADVIADFYTPEAFKRAPDDITICKNGGGAHLDLMTCRHILEAWQAQAG